MSFRRDMSDKVRYLKNEIRSARETISEGEEKIRYIQSSCAHPADRQMREGLNIICLDCLREVGPRDTPS